MLRGGDVARFITDCAPALCLRLVLTEDGARRLRTVAGSTQPTTVRASAHGDAARWTRPEDPKDRMRGERVTVFHCWSSHHATGCAAPTVGLTRHRYARALSAP